MELPGCIAAILCRTTPLDVIVSKTFRSTADSDTVWNHFLLSNYHSIVFQSPSLANGPSKKALYLALSDHPVIIDQGKRKSGKKCHMLGARALTIVWVTMSVTGSASINLPESSFSVYACSHIDLTV
ncbi:F-box protein PP2-B11-like [Lotus japonicus]|uniref:F-box protein PP2-B11-like n=1 Tax=Lotus japonicus TaxID=34305 RepID=UPI00258B14AD|nr:F-box protein PP2-B11-like [Lotus japonicus]